MIELTDETPVYLRRGVYTFQVNVSTGPVVFSWSLDGENGTYYPISDGSFSSTSDGNMTLSDCHLKASIPSGDTAFIDTVDLTY